MTATKCLVVDDHTVVTQGLDLLLGDIDDLELVGTVHSGEEALEAVERLKPQVVLMDVRLPGIDGVSAVKRIQPTAEQALSEREREILQLLAEGYHTEEVARRIGLSVETVKSDTKRVIAKLQADTRTHAVAIALRQAIID